MTPRGSPADGAGKRARPHGAFATTHWSLIGRAAEVGTSEGQAALEELCRVYWRPLYWFARRRGHALQDAEDLTQGFFADLLAREGLAQADPARGRFRTFLLAAFENYANNQRAREHCLKRGGGCRIISLEELQQAESQFRDEPVTTDSPEARFDRTWALRTLEQTLEALREEYVAQGKAATFDALKVLLWGGRGELHYGDLARRLGATESAIKSAVHRVRQRFRQQLRVEVAKTLLHPEDADDELRHLFSALGA